MSRGPVHQNTICLLFRRYANYANSVSTAHPNDAFAVGINAYFSALDDIPRSIIDAPKRPLINLVAANHWDKLVPRVFMEHYTLTENNRRKSPKSWAYNVVCVV